LSTPRAAARHSPTTPIAPGACDPALANRRRRGIDPVRYGPRRRVAVRHLEEHRLDPVPVLTLIGLLFVKEAGVPVPVPGDLLVLGAGVAASGTGLAAPVELAGLLAAGYAGGSVQFLLVRGTLRDRLLRLLARLGVSRERLDRLADWLRRRGAGGVAAARLTPGLRVGAIAASALADLRFGGVFLPGLVGGNTVFVGGHFALGYVIGAPAMALVAGLGGAAAAVVGLVVLAGAGAVAWTVLRRRSAARRATAPAPGVANGDLPGYGAWTEAACPACLAISIYRER
jgi:membrane protein DedA with SNARE-associated domain